MNQDVKWEGLKWVFVCRVVGRGVIRGTEEGRHRLLGSHPTRAYTQMRVFRFSLPVSLTNSQEQGDYKPCGMSSAAVTTVGETGVPHLLLPCPR